MLGKIGSIVRSQTAGKQNKVSKQIQKEWERREDEDGYLTTAGVLPLKTKKNVLAHSRNRVVNQISALQLEKSQNKRLNRTDYNGPYF